MSPSGTLVLAWGNPGRRDDGLGPALAARLRPPDDVRLLTVWQPQIEHAVEVAAHPRVVFVDADRSGPAPFRWERIRADPSTLGFSSHSVTPGALLALARELFDAEPEAWILGVRGEEFADFGEELSPAGRAHLEEAVEFLDRWLRRGSARPATEGKPESPPSAAPLPKEESP